MEDWLVNKLASHCCFHCITLYSPTCQSHKDLDVLLVSACLLEAILLKSLALEKKAKVKQVKSITLFLGINLTL